MNKKEYNDFLDTCIEQDMKKQEEQLILKLLKSKPVDECKSTRPPFCTDCLPEKPS